MEIIKYVLYTLIGLTITGLLKLYREHKNNTNDIKLINKDILNTNEKIDDVKNTYLKMEDKIEENTKNTYKIIGMLENKNK